MSDFITKYVDNKHLFGGKATKRDVFEKLAEKFTKASGRLVRRERGACERIGLNDKWKALFPDGNSQQKFSEIFCKWKTPTVFVPDYGS